MFSPHLTEHTMKLICYTVSAAKHHPSSKWPRKSAAPAAKKWKSWGPFPSAKKQCVKANGKLKKGWRYGKNGKCVHAKK